MIKKNLIYWIALLFLLSCTAQPQLPATEDSGPALTGTRWELVELNGNPIPSLEKKPFIELFEKDARLTGHSGCNGFFGSYTHDGDRLAFGPVGMTHMACQNIMDLEHQFMNALDQTDAFQISGGFLIFLSHGKPVVRFAKSSDGK